MKRLIAAVIIVLMLIPAIRAQVIVDPLVIFGDANLQSAVEAELADSSITVNDMKNLTSLNTSYRGITNLFGLENATNLTELSLLGNQISDLSPLEGLTKLTDLRLVANQIINLSPLAGLTNLTYLNLSFNQISDVSRLAGLTNLSTLVLENNRISDISPLAGLTNLEWLALDNNQISVLPSLAGLTSLSTLSLHNNRISDLSPLANLTNLEALDIWGNQISNLSPLARLRNLHFLNLSGNQISDISPLVTLADYRLELVYLTENPLNLEAYDTYIPELLAAGIVVYYDPIGTVEVPDVVGMRSSDAIQALENEQFTVQKVEVYSETVDIDYVISQDPAGGTWAVLGSAVTVTVSNGPPPPEAVEVPEVVGMLQTHAEQDLTSVGLTVAIVNAPSETVPASHVISQNPVAGTQVAVGSAVTLTISTGPGGGPGPGPGPDLSAPVTYWALDETAGLTAFDSAGSHDGRLYGNPTWLPQGGMIDGALQFDGVDDYVDCGTFNPSAATGQLTVCLWAKWNGLTGSFQGLIGKRDTWEDSHMMWQLEASRDDGMVGFFREGSGRRDGFVLPVGQWVHIAATCDGSTARLYLDGQQVVSGPMTFGYDTAAALVFGACEKDGGNPFNGMLDDVQLYDRVLNAQQIQAVMGLSIPGLVGHWRLDETQGTIAFDSAGSHDGRLYGNPSWQPEWGMIGGALRFDGVDDYVDCGTFNPSSATGKLTVCLWAKWDGLTGRFQGLIGKRDTWDASQMMWQLEASQDRGMVGFFRNGSGRNDGFLMPVGQWVHIAATCDGTTSQLYLDGQQVVSTPMTFGSDTASALVFGACEKNGGNPFNGMLDDVQLYDEVLNEQQIQAVMTGYTNSLGSAVEEGLVAHYAFEGNAEDSASGHHGDVYGATWTQGMTGLALRLDGDDYVEVADDAAFDMTEAVSVAAWVNLEAVNADWLGIVTKGDSTWRLSTYLSEQRFHFGVNDQPGSYHTVDGVTYVPLNEWHYVVGTFDGSLIRLYVDGVEDPASPVPYTGAIYTDDYPVWIGANSEQSGRNFVGMIDEVMIYNRALSQTEVLGLMAQTD